MHICWKSFFLSFGVALFLFSLLMLGICMGVFDKFVPSAEREISSEVLPIPSAEKRMDYESYIFYCNDKDNKTLDFALLVRVDETEKQMIATYLSGEDIIERQGLLFYIRSLCQTYGTEELSPIFATLTGFEAPKTRIQNVRDYLPLSEQSATVRYVDFMELLPSVLDKTGDGFSISECPLVLDENRVLNVEKSLDVFLPSK